MAIKKNYLMGSKFFDDNGAIVRVEKVRNRNKYIVRNMFGELLKINYEQLHSLTRLRPVGILSIFEADIGNGQRDVIVSLHRSKDLAVGIKEPFIGARQSMINMFSLPFATSIDGIPLGLCYSRLTCPRNVEFTTILECKKVISSQVVSVYLDDTLDDMLSFVNTTPFDSIIARFCRKFDPLGTRGIPKTFKGFMEANSFMVEFGNAFNILDLKCDEEPYPIGNNDEKIFITPRVQNEIEHKLSCKITIVQVAKYDERFDITRVENKTEFIFVRNNINYKPIYCIKFLRGENILSYSPDQKEYVQELLNRI